MNGLEHAFYIMAIIYMAISFLLLIALAAAVLAIRAKINRIHDNIEQKLSSITNFAEKGGQWAAKASEIVTKATKKSKK